jgi:hypothetical protein
MTSKEVQEMMISEIRNGITDFVTKKHIEANWCKHRVKADHDGFACLQLGWWLDYTHA